MSTFKGLRLHDEGIQEANNRLHSTAKLFIHNYILYVKHQLIINK